MKCEYCGRDIGYHDKNCVSCGAPIPPKNNMSRRQRLRIMYEKQKERENARQEKLKALENKKTVFREKTEEYNCMETGNFFSAFWHSMGFRYRWKQAEENGCLDYSIFIFILIVFLLKNCCC